MKSHLAGLIILFVSLGNAFHIRADEFRRNEKLFFPRKTIEDKATQLSRMLSDENWEQNLAERVAEIKDELRPGSMHASSTTRSMSEGERSSIYSIYNILCRSIKRDSQLHSWEQVYALRAKIASIGIEHISKDGSYTQYQVYNAALGLLRFCVNETLFNERKVFSDTDAVIKDQIRPFLIFLSIGNRIHVDDFVWVEMPPFTLHRPGISPAMIVGGPTKEDLKDPEIRAAYEQYRSDRFRQSNISGLKKMRERFIEREYPIFRQRIVAYLRQPDAPLAEFRALLEEFPELQEFGEGIWAEIGPQYPEDTPDPE